MRLSTSQKFEIRHPEHPEIIVRGRYPAEVERLELGRKLGHREALIVKDPETRQPVYDQQTRQTMVSHVTEAAPFPKIAKALEPFIEEIEGLEIDGRPGKLEDLANVRLGFYRDDPIEDPINGQPWTDPRTGRKMKVVMRDGEPVRQPNFTIFLNDVMNEMLLPSRNGDGSKKESSTSSTGS